MLKLDPQERITPEEAMKHCYFEDYSKYKTQISMNLDESNLYDNDLVVAEELGKMESINLAENFKNIKHRYQPTPSFKLKNSIHFNPNPELNNGIDTFSEI